MVIEWIWTVITGVGFLICMSNAYRAKKLVGLVRREERDPNEKLALLSIAYGRLLRQLGMTLAVFFNFTGGFLVLTTPPSPVRSDVVIAMLMASAFTLTIMSLVEAVREE